MKSKRGVELSINFIVILVISLVIFGFGMKLLFDGIRGADELIPESSCRDSDLDVQLARSPVAVCPSDVVVGRGKSASVKLGIHNSADFEEFTVMVKANSCVDKADSPITDSQDSEGRSQQCSRWAPFSGIGVNRDSIRVPKGQSLKFNAVVSVRPDAPSGTYIADVCVKDAAIDGKCDANSKYGAIQKVYVTVT